MIQDKLARFSDAQAITTSSASTDVINTLAAGDSYEGAWFVAGIDTTVAGGASVTTTFQLQTSANEDFSTSAATLVQSAAYLTASLTAGKMFVARIPPGARKYLRAYKVVGGTGVLTAGAYDFYIVKDIDVEFSRRYLLNYA